MLVRPNGRFITQRELPRMALVGTQLDADALDAGRARHADASRCARAGGRRIARVTVWKFDGRGIDCGDARRGVGVAVPGDSRCGW